MGDVDEAYKHKISITNLLAGGAQLNIMGASVFANSRNQTTESHEDYGMGAFKPVTETMGDVGEDIVEGAKIGAGKLVTDLTKTGAFVTGIDALDSLDKSLRAAMPEEDYNTIVGPVTEEIVRQAPYAAAGAYVGKITRVGVLASEIMLLGTAGFVRDPDDPGAFELLQSLGMTEDNADEVRIAAEKSKDPSDFQKRLMSGAFEFTAAVAFASLFKLGKLALGKKTLDGRNGDNVSTTVNLPETQAMKESLEDTTTVGPRQKDVRKPPEVDFNFGRMNTNDDVIEQLDLVSKNFSKEIDEAKRGVITHEATVDLAKLVNLTEGELIAANKGTVLNAEQMLAARSILIKSGENLHTLATRVVDVGTPEDLLEFRKHFSRHALLQQKVKGIQTEIARALSQFNIVGSGNLDEVAGILDQFGSTGAVQDMAAKYLTFADPAKANDFVSRSWGATTKDAVFEFWINGLLSGIKTHAVNISSNSIFAITQVPERFGAALIGAGRKSGDKVPFSEVGNLMVGMIEGSIDGLRLATRSFISDTPSSYATKLEHARRKSITAQNFNLDENSIIGRSVDYLGTVARLPGRALMAEDELFKAIGQRGQLRALASRKHARIFAQTGDEGAAQQAYSDAMRGLDKEINDAARDFSEIVTFTKELGSTGRAVQRFISAVPFAKVVAPFVRTPLNIFKSTTERIPGVGFLMKDVRDEFAKGGAARDMVVSKMAFGGTLMAGGAYWAAQGNLTGSGPKDPRKVADLRNTGWQPYSMVFKKGEISEENLTQLRELNLVSESTDKVFVAYNRLEPTGSFLGVAATAFDTIKYADGNNATDMATAAIAATMKNLGDKTFLQGVGMVAEAWTDPDRFAQSYIKKLAGSLVPTIVADVARFQDPTLRETRSSERKDTDMSWLGETYAGVVNTIQSRIPGLSDSLPPRLNFWGNEVNLGSGAWHDLINPFYISQGKGSKLDDELVELASPLSMPERTLEEVPLTPIEYNRLIQLMSKETRDANGVDMRQAMEELIKAPAYAIMGPVDRSDSLRGVQRKYLGTTEFGARASLLQEFPVLLEKVTRARELRKIGVEQ